MEPIVPINETAKPRRSAARGTLADLLACIISGAAALTALTYSALFFSRFLENDSHFWGIVSAFLLCFGVGAFGYVPAAINSLIAWRAHKNGASKVGLIWSLILLLPWLGLAAVLVFISDMPKIYSLPLFLTAALLTAWALISLRSFHKR